MPFATSFYHDRRLIIRPAWGHITLDDVRAYRPELAARPECDPTWAHVVDVVFATGVPPDIYSSPVAIPYRTTPILHS